jgi:hypothetical protein
LVLNLPIFIYGLSLFRELFVYYKYFIKECLRGEVVTHD